MTGGLKWRVSAYQWGRDEGVSIVRKQYGVICLIKRASLS